MTGRSQDKLKNAALMIAPFTIRIMHWPDTRLTVWIKPFLPITQAYFCRRQGCLQSFSELFSLAFGSTQRISDRYNPEIVRFSRIIVPKCIILQPTILNCQHSRKKEKPRANSLHLLLHPFTAQSRCSQLLKIRTLQSCGIYNSWRSLKPHLEVDASLEVSTYTNGFISTAYGSIGNNYQCYHFVTLYCLIGLALTIKYMTYSLCQVRLY